MSKTKIVEAFAGMDALDDDQWTQNGDPLVDYLKEKTGIEVLTRQEIFEADPSFNRKKLMDGGNAEEANDEEETSGEKVNDEEIDLEIDTSSAGILADFDEPLPEKEFAQFIRGVPKEDLEEIESLIMQQQTEVTRNVEHLNDLRNRLKMSLMFVQSRIKTELPMQSNPEAIRAYITSQNQQRAERSAKQKAVMSQFGSLKDINPHSPLDQAMARKTKRGGKRPVRALLK